MRAASMRGRYRDRKIRNLIVHSVERICVPPPVDEWAHFGHSLVVAPARIECPDCISIGDDVIILENVWMSVVRHFPDITPRLVIEDSVRIGRGCQLSVIGELVIERCAIIGDFVQIGDTVHPHDVDDRLAALTRPKPVRIGRGAIVGSHATVLPGVQIGAGAYVEHHSMVNRDVPEGVVVAGSPARPVAPRA
jgi:acetyltransferase-like isoleucine patch superfamily enzyme